MRLIGDDLWAIMTIWGEARGEPQAGRVAVAEVIRNRTTQRYSSEGTAVSTCLWPVQFSCWNAVDKNRLSMGALDDQDPLVAQCRQAWETAQGGSDTVHGAVLYVNLYLAQPKWISACERLMEIGRHTFYRPKVHK